MEYELAFLKALALTVVLEVIAAAALKYLFGRRLRIQENYTRFLGMVVLASTLTLPYVWFILPAAGLRGIAYIATSELAVFLAEAAWYRFTLKTNIQTALILSLVANAFSYFIGNVLL